MGKALIIVDPQYDFIDGTLPVGGAQDAMDALASYLDVRQGVYKLVIVTVDWHPTDHSSFVENGGQWPRHCVRYTNGASIYQPIADALLRVAPDYTVLTKGTLTEREEYSVFQNQESSSILKDLLLQHHIDHIDICGIAGDVCVLNTLKDGVARLGSDKFYVLTEYSPSLDGGTLLQDTIKQLNVCTK